MMRRDPSASLARRVAVTACWGAMALCAAAGTAQAAADYPVTEKQRGQAQRVAQDGVPLADLAANAPESYTVKPRDTLWDISKLFLKTPWRWPELWGMNAQQIRNPHLIYPGQLLYLDKSNGRARLRVGQAVGDGAGPGRLSPRVRATPLQGDSLPSIPFNLIEPFLTEAVIFQSNELESAPRIVATQEGRVMMGRGDTAYVRGELTGGNEYRIFRTPRPLRDPATKEVLGYEATYVGAAEYTRQGETRIDAAGKAEVVPATFVITNIRQEAGIGDRLAVVPSREFTNYAPHAPQDALSGQIASLYGDALTAGQNQIVALNRGSAQGVERGHVLALIRDGVRVLDRTDATRPIIKLPDERHGYLFVFRVFERMSYALILSVKEPVKVGDHFGKP